MLLFISDKNLRYLLSCDELLATFCMRMKTNLWCFRVRPRGSLKPTPILRLKVNTRSSVRTRSISRAEHARNSNSKKRLDSSHGTTDDAEVQF